MGTLIYDFFAVPVKFLIHECFGSYSSEPEKPKPRFAYISLTESDCFGNPAQSQTVPKQPLVYYSNNLAAGGGLFELQKMFLEKHRRKSTLVHCVFDYAHDRFATGTDSASNKEYSICGYIRGESFSSGEDYRAMPLVWQQPDRPDLTNLALAFARKLRSPTPTVTVDWQFCRSLVRQGFAKINVKLPEDNEGVECMLVFVLGAALLPLLSSLIQFSVQIVVSVLAPVIGMMMMILPIVAVCFWGFLVIVVALAFCMWQYGWHGVPEAKKALEAAQKASEAERAKLQKDSEAVQAALAPWETWKPAYGSSCAEELQKNHHILEKVACIARVVTETRAKAAQLRTAGLPALPVPLTDDELFALVAYTHDLRSGDPEQNLYYQLNTALRPREVTTDGKQNLVKTWGGYVGFLFRALNKLPDVSHIPCFRGTSFPLTTAAVTDCTKNKSIRFNAFTSVTKNTWAEHLDRGFAKRTEDGINYEINLKFGKDIAAYSFFPEGEILVLPNRVFKITDDVMYRDRAGNNYTTAGAGRYPVCKLEQQELLEY